MTDPTDLKLKQKARWYFAEGTRQIGPFSESEFLDHVRSGRVRADTLAWRSGLPDWQPYETLAKQDALPPPRPAPVKEAAAEGQCAECRNFFPFDDMIPYQDVWICAGCKPAFIQKLKEGAVVAGTMDYAGFWVRAGAKLIDSIIIGAVNMILSLLAGVLGQSGQPSAAGIIVAIVVFVFQIAFAAAYTTWFLGKYEATPGKLLLRIKVVRADGDRVSYPLALGRHFAEWISSMILGIGYLMAAFDDQKRTLHDRICETRVIRRDS